MLRNPFDSVSFPGQWLQHHRLLESTEISAYVGATPLWYLRGCDAEDA